jgi:hypothetical protein
LPASAPSSGVNPALAAALDNLAARSRAIRSNVGLAQVQTSVADGLAASRIALQATRNAAYNNGIRDCGNVAAHMRATQAGAARVNSAAASLSGVASARQRQLDELNAAIAQVRTLAAQRGSAAGVPTAAEIAAAVAAAGAQAGEEAASLTGTRASTADGVTKARSMSSTAAGIYTKAC